MTIKFFNDPERLWKLFTLMLDGAGVTLSIFFLTLVFSVPLGMLVAQGRMSRRRLVRAPLSFYIYIMRSTPLMLQIMFIYFLLPQVLPFRVDRFWAVIFAFVINYACYFSEIYRGGIESVPQGQYEAGQVLGMTKSQIFFKVVLLQVVKRILAPMGNEFITLVKDTALARIIAIYEIVYVGESYIKKGLIWPLFYTAAFYLLFNGVLTVLFAKLEKKLDYFRG